LKQRFGASSNIAAAIASTPALVHPDKMADLSAAMVRAAQSSEPELIGHDSLGRAQTSLSKRTLPRLIVWAFRAILPISARLGNAAGGRDGDLPLPRDGKFADSPLEERVYCELVSEKGDCGAWLNKA
jgi:hypothetical protein